MQRASKVASPSEEFSLDSYFSNKHSFRKAGATSILALATLILGSAALPTPAAFAQATPTSGAIQGSITDSSGAAVPNAQISITNTATSTTRTATTDSAGLYNSGALNPGQYKIVIAAPGFQTLQSTIAVN